MTTKQASAVELLPCPFCGFPDPEVELLETHMGERWAVTCCACDCVGSINWPSDHDPTRDGAIRFWNTRAQPTSASDDREGLVERLRGILYRYDPMCGDEDCGRTARAAFDEISALLASTPKPATSEVERPDDDAIDPLLPQTVRGAKRCGIQRSAWMDHWFVPWSPRNDNENAEGPWSHWVLLAKAILAADEKAVAALAGKDVEP